MKSGNNKAREIFFWMLLCVFLCACGAAPAEGMEVGDTSGISDPLAGAQRNPDGSITIESGTYGVDIEDQAERAPLSPDEWQQRLNRAAALNGAETPTVYKDPVTGEISDVEVVYMGIGRSMIILNGEKRMVNTVDLEWMNEAPDGKVLAVVFTPKNGYAAMYAGKSKKTTLLKQCRTDSVVRVISSGDRWTLVDHEGMRGYVQTSSLEFFLNDHVEFQAGMISVKGRTKGRDTVNIRSRDDKCRVLQDYTLGTPLTVFDMVDDWAEVDVCGWHCRINSKYVTLEKETASAD